MEHAPTVNMDDTPTHALLRPKRYSAGGQTPMRQTRDPKDILSQITPATAVEALTYPNDALRKCLSEAGLSEREFAMRTAVAARNVWNWRDEVGDWSWPDESGSKGFEQPGGKLRRLSIQVTPPDNQSYIGSLLEEEVHRYEKRVEEIYDGLEELGVEELKTHILANHILPMSRPATPISDSGMGLRGYHQMDDLAAVVTAIVVQTLPDLARLHELLRAWGIRILVLQHVPGLMLAIEDAEVALRSGWAAITPSATWSDKQTVEPPLTRKDFGVMKVVIERKIHIPGGTLDYMLDKLEGSSDTLPDEWLDRMEAVEIGYAEWVAACERKIGETEWARASHSYDSSPQPATSALRSEPEHDESNLARSKNDEDKISCSSSFSSQEMPKLQLSLDDPQLSFDGSQDDLHTSRLDIPTPIQEEHTSSPESFRKPKWNIDDDICSPVGLEDEPELPELPNERRVSNASQNSTLQFGASSRFDMSSDDPRLSASPEVARTQLHDAAYYSTSFDDSPPSSPPVPEADTSTRANSVADHDEESTLPKTPLEGSMSEYFDDSFSVTEIMSPNVRRGSSGDHHLRQQISDIIDQIPAKIKLSGEAPNLNPPDLQLPRLRQKPSKEPMMKRTMSSLSNMSTKSSRTATPSFTLSPAKSSRPRQHWGQQEIKVYHLSRSTGEAPIKLFIRCVGETGERVMVRVGGGWADLGEYLKDYASHHGRRSKGHDEATVELSDGPRGLPRSSPSSRPASAMGTSPLAPLAVRKARGSSGAAGSERPQTLRACTAAPPLPPSRNLSELMPSPEQRAVRSRSSSHVSWKEENTSLLGLAGPSSKKAHLSQENLAWVESVKEKVRMASGDRKLAPPLPLKQDDYSRDKFGELGRVGGTKRVFRRSEGPGQIKDVRSEGLSR